MFSSYGPVPNQTEVSIGEFGFGLRALNGPEHGRSDIPREPDARNVKFSRSRYVPVGCDFCVFRFFSFSHFPEEFVSVTADIALKPMQRRLSQHA
jgi:hypothetical protein